MNTKDVSNDQEVNLYLRNAVFKSLAAILGLVIIGAVIFYLFDDQVQSLTQWTSDQFGFWGMAAIVFAADTFIVPFPPDLILVIIAKSDLHQNWMFYVGVLGGVSVIGGNIGGFFGRKLRSFAWAKRFFGQIKEENKRLVHKLGFWSVVIGAATPLPFSVTCWTAGFLGMKKRLIFLACLVRIPRYYVYYLLIRYSDFLGTSLNQ